MNTKTMGWIRLSTLPILLVTLLLTATGCRSGSRGADRLAEDSSAAQQVDSNLTFNNITLEQADEQGRVLWKVQSEQVVYSPDQRVATVVNPDGELYQEGKAVYQVQAQEGEVRRDGERIFLRGNVVATDIKSGAILRGNEMEWQPKRDLLIVRGNLRGTHPQLQVSADEARASNRRREVELTGQIQATTLDNPKLQLEGERIVWQLDNEMVISDRPLVMQQLEGEQVTEQAESNRAEVNLQAKTVKLLDNAILTLTEPPLQIRGNSLLWNMDEKTLVSDQAVTAVQRQEQVTLTADQGRMEFEPQTAYFMGNVRATGQQNQALLTADQLTWQIDSQRVEAEGNVVYTQPDPPATLRGPKAVGRLQDRTIVVSGGRVETQIVPNGDFNFLPDGAN
ncbi:LPS export ABC transporter periplasmic protein LptC [Thermocoleostomius sinensis]|uniref:LPS export ABC transporter periplasmic protein LptC n=1 Tax=Thermocoleostomius sinensis A174 TaxID=2016057 RepID=A0A9E8Z9J2_9CYAN|nr:LPS export ABC transporter periplasmic protein LptC [Thermocoleostomius sinensis]WAL59034.1 LPS export ABC transporter periplasmic protein LptC [Thermocoleostomius sinensis A174]